MGVKNNISIDSFPKQGKHLGAEVEVCFHYDTANTIKGMIVRDDTEEPFVTLIHLEDDRVVLGTECQYSSNKNSIKIDEPVKNNTDLQQKHHQDVISLLSGGFGENINNHNYQDRVDLAVDTASYLANKLCGMYGQKRTDSKKYTTESLKLFEKVLIL